MISHTSPRAERGRPDFTKPSHYRWRYPTPALPSCHFRPWPATRPLLPNPRGGRVVQTTAQPAGPAFLGTAASRGRSETQLGRWAGLAELGSPDVAAHGGQPPMTRVAHPRGHKQGLRPAPRPLRYPLEHPGPDLYRNAHDAVLLRRPRLQGEPHVQDQARPAGRRPSSPGSRRRLRSPPPCGRRTTSRRTPPRRSIRDESSSPRSTDVSAPFQGKTKPLPLRAISEALT